MKSFDGCVLNQGFAENANNAYRAYGGHPGLDTSCGYGSDILSPVSGVVSAVYTPERPANDGYVAIYILVETTLEKFEFTTGHCSKVFVKVGDHVTKGQMIGQEGNRGLVYAGSRLITLAMQKAGIRDGHHRHYQKRPVRAVKARAAGKTYLKNAKGYVRTAAGQYLEVMLPYAQQASCVDFTKPLFSRKLIRGSAGYEVILLQRALGLPEVSQTGFFGPETEKALKQFQTANGLEAVGVVGPATRAFMNAHYGQLEDPVIAPVTPENALEVVPIISAAKASLETVMDLPEASQPVVLSAWNKLLALISRALTKG